MEFESKTAMLTDNNGRPTYNVLFSLNNSQQLHDNIKKLLDFYSLVKIFAEISFSHSPSPNPVQDFLQAQCNVSVEASKNFFLLPNKMMPSPSFAAFMVLLESLNLVQFTCHFDDMKDFYYELAKKEIIKIPEQLKILNFDGILNISNMLKGQFVEKYGKKIPKATFKTYSKVKEYLNGIENVELIVGNKSLKVSFENMDIFCLLPDIEPPEEET